ncbi:MFS transporter, partial [Corynebacterium striatum]
DATPADRGAANINYERKPLAVPGTWNPGTNYADSRYQLPQIDNGDNVIFYGALASFMIGLVVLAIAVADWEVVIAGALVGLGYGSIMPAAQAVAVRLVAPHEMGAGISTLFLLLDIGIGFGPVVLGMLISALGYSAMYWVLAATVALATVLYYFVHGRRAYGETVHVTAATA